MITKNRKGFTLVELNLAMIFVALLILGIAVLTISVSKLYQRGVLIKDVNYVGREIMSQLRRDIAEADPSVVSHIVADDNATSGRLCLGNISYVYNTAKGLTDADEGLLATGIIVRGADDPIALVRISDIHQEWCDTSGDVLIDTIGESLFEAGTATELMPRDSFASTAIHALSLENYPSALSGQGALVLYALQVRLGTSNVKAISETGEACLPPEDNESDFDACFVTDHTTIIRAGGY